MIRLLFILVIFFVIASCSSTSTAPNYAEDQRVELAQRLEAEGLLADALFQWRVLRALYSNNNQINDEINRLNSLIQQRKQTLLTSLERIPTNRKESDAKKRQKILLKILALTPDDIKAKEALRDITWDKALEEASAKKQNIVKYLAENQRKARREIEISNLNEQGQSLIKSGKYQSVLQVAKKLEKLSPKHAQLKTLRSKAYLGMAKLEAKNGPTEKSIKYLEQAMTYMSKEESKKVSKQALSQKEALADGHFEKGLLAIKRNVDQAVIHFQNAVAIYPQHARANKELQRAKVIQENLQKIKNMRIN